MQSSSSHPEPSAKRDKTDYSVSLEEFKRRAESFIDDLRDTKLKFVVSGELAGMS